MNPESIVIKEFNKKTRMLENVRIRILKAERKTRKNGESIALELEELIVYMPERYLFVPKGTQRYPT